MEKIKKFLSVIALSLVLGASTVAVMPTPVASALDCTKPQNAQERCECFKKGFQLSSGNVTDTQPFFCSASDAILFGINTLTIFSGVIAVLFLVIGGFWYVTSAGNDEQAEKGKKTLVNSIIGLIVISLAYTIVRIIANTLQNK